MKNSNTYFQSLKSFQPWFYYGDYVEYQEFRKEQERQLNQQLQKAVDQKASKA